MLIEVLVACSIISIVTFGVFSAAQRGIQLSQLALRETQASFLLEEGVESVKTIRDTSWTTISNLTLGVAYYLSFNTTNNTWSLEITPNTTDNFTRTVVFSDVYRNSNDDIASSGTLDVRTKKVSVNVAWPSSSGTASKTLSFYLADIFN